MIPIESWTDHTANPARRHEGGRVFAIQARLATLKRASERRPHGSPLTVMRRDTNDPRCRGRLRVNSPTTVGVLKLIVSQAEVGSCLLCEGLVLGTSFLHNPELL